MKKILSWLKRKFKLESPESYVIPEKQAFVPRNFKVNTYGVKLYSGEVFTVCAQMFEVVYEHQSVWFWMVDNDGTRKSGVAYFKLVDVQCIIDEQAIPEQKTS